MGSMDVLPSNLRNDRAIKIAGRLTVVASVVAVIAALAPMRRHAADYFERFARLARADMPLFEAATGARRGFDVLPRPVQAMADVLAREKLRSYWASPALLESGQPWQRLVEGAWPRIPRATATAIFVLASKGRNPTCRIVPVPNSGYELAICP